MCRPDQVARRSDLWTSRAIERITTMVIWGRKVRGRELFWEGIRGADVPWNAN